MADEAPNTTRATSRLGPIFRVAVALALAVELSVYAVLVAFAPIQLGVELGRLLVGLPIQLAEPGIYLLGIWGAGSLLASAALAVKGRLSTRGRARALQRLVLLTCALLQAYAATRLSMFLATWSEPDGEFVLTVLLLVGAMGILLACGVLWLRAPSVARSSLRRADWWAAGAVGILSGALAIHGSMSCTRYSFSPTVWKQGKGGWAPAPTTRQLLVERLLECKTLKRQSKAQVRVLLGKPTARSNLESPELAADWYYDLGPKRALISVSGYTETLYVRFSRTGDVRSVAVLGKY